MSIVLNFKKSDDDTLQSTCMLMLSFRLSLSPKTTHEFEASTMANPTIQITIGTTEKALEITNDEVLRKSLGTLYSRCTYGYDLSRKPVFRAVQIVHTAFT